ncbi:MAG: tetratricopeptide repeat protein [Chitinophagaceae bacterium]|nr:tetratricopeptide repeat protein [Chitinophagaceae bacterium]
MKIKVSCCICLLLSAIIFSCNTADEGTNPAPAATSTGVALVNLHTKYPDSLALTEKLIEYYRDKGSYDSAINITDIELKKDSMNAEFWDIKATLHFENEDTSGAIRALETAISIYPLPEYIISLGSLYAETKNQKALVMADALLNADKAKAAREAIFIKGLYYSYTGDKKKAISLFDSCIHRDYTYMFAYREKAIALYDLSKYEDALQVLAKAVTVQNNFDEGYYWMGKCYQKLNRKNEAIQSYQTALLYDKDFGEAIDSLKKLGVR